MYNKGHVFPRRRLNHGLANIYENFTDLPVKEQHSLFEAIKETLFPAPKVQGGTWRYSRSKVLGWIGMFALRQLKCKTEW